MPGVSLECEGSPRLRTLACDQSHSGSQASHRPLELALASALNYCWSTYLEPADEAPSLPSQGHDRASDQRASQWPEERRREADRAGTCIGAFLNVWLNWSISSKSFSSSVCSS